MNVGASNAVAVVVPTADRPAYLEEFIAYCRSWCSAWPIIVADGSRGGDAAERNEAAVRAAQGELDLHYARFPAELPFAERILAAIDSIEAPLILLAGDDDFPVAEGVADASRLMADRPDFSAVRGHVLKIRPVGEAVSTLGIKLFPFTPVIQDTALQRIAALLARYNPTFYSLHRRDGLRTALSTMPGVLMENVAMAEVYLAAAGAAAGKIANINRLMFLRAESALSGGVTRPFQSALDDPDFSAKFTSFARALAQVAAATDGCPEQDAEAAIRTAYRRHLTVRPRPDVASVRHAEFARNMFVEGTVERNDTLAVLRDVVARMHRIWAMQTASLQTPGSDT